MKIVSLLAADNYFIFNKYIARKFGLIPAVLLGCLCTHQQKQNGEFELTYETISYETSLTRYEILNGLKILRNNKLIKTNKKGMPAQNYYVVDENELYNTLNPSDTNTVQQEVSVPSDTNTVQPVIRVSNDNINNIYNNKDLYNNTLHSSKDKCNYIINKSGEPQAVAKPKQIQLKSSHKKSLLENDLVFDDLMEKRKEIISRPRPRVQTENVATKSKKELKRESYLRKAIEITTQTLKLSEPEKISLIKDWFETLYDKGFTSTELPKFKYALEEVQNAFTKYPWETFNKIIKDAITANHSTLRYVIQSQNSSRYNKQTLSDRIKFPGMRENESVDEYIGRTKEIEDERQKALKEIEEAENDDSKPWY